VRLAIGAVSLVLVTLVARPEPRSRPVVGTSEQLRAILIASTWREAARVRTCPRPALREPANGDATALLPAIFYDPSRRKASPFAACDDHITRLQGEIKPPCAKRPCRLAPLASLSAHPEVAEACAPMHELIERVAHASAACSPFTADTVDQSTWFVTWIPQAVHLHIAPWVQRGELARAARHVLDAMRLADDLGREGTLIGGMIGVAFTVQLTETLHELLADPRMDTAVASAIAADLDKLRASAPGFVPMMRQENLWLLSQLEHADAVTGDPAQDQALMILERARLMDGIERACAQESPFTCGWRLSLVPGAELWVHYAHRLARRDMVLDLTSMLASPSALAR
jgi:hypothetical protein